MNHDEIHGSWSQVIGKVQEQWQLLSHIELIESQGRFEYLQNKLQERYGHAKDEATKEIEEFFRQLENKD